MHPVPVLEVDRSPVESRGKYCSNSTSTDTVDCLNWYPYVPASSLDPRVRVGKRTRRANANQTSSSPPA